MNDFESFFDEHGRMIPLSHKYPVHKKTRRYFNIQPVEINYEKIYNKIKSFLDPSTSLSLKASVTFNLIPLSCNLAKTS